MHIKYVQSLTTMESNTHHKQRTKMEGLVLKPILLIDNILILFLLLSPFTISSAGTSSSRENPFTAKASLIRFWNKHVSNNHTKPHFLLSKASPLSAVEAAFFAKLATQKALSFHLSSFCTAANLFCLFDSTPVFDEHDEDSDFTFYSNKRFADYGTSRTGGVDAFKSYSIGVNLGTDSFTRYSRSSTGHDEKFTTYAANGNVAGTNFTSYGSGSTGGSGEFTSYHRRVNVPKLQFTNYDTEGNNHKLSFSSYANDTNSGSEGFTEYAKNGNGVPVEFSGYGDNSNLIGSKFTGYGELGNAANDSFKDYNSNSNDPHNNFKSYGVGSSSAMDSFSSYRNGASSGIDSFQSYAKDSNSAKSSLVNYGKTIGEGTDVFKEYGEGSFGQSIEFKAYGVRNTFKGYAQKGVTFAQYENSSFSDNSVNKFVEPGKFFRECLLKEGTIVRMPDIRDKMPRRSFLPLAISSKLPSSTSRLSELKKIFHARDNSATERVIVNALAECERTPSQGETKSCVASVEEMIGFAVSILGRNAVVQTTENVNGSNRNVMIGRVKPINGGRVTKSVSCHQTLYPYLLYYCHSVPKVRAYVADILDEETKVKINHGVAICHLDTSAWSPGHVAFIALGSSPGLIEACHWIFENDMVWTIAG